MLVVIPARGGSKGIPGKNIKDLGGKPLISYTIEAVRDIFEPKDVLVSTDSEKIKEIVEQLGFEVPFLRPKSLATDKSGTYEVLLHALDFMEARGKYYDTLLLLQPTSPFRKSRHIKEAIEEYNHDCEMLVSVKETKANPYYLLREENEFGYLVKSKEGNFTRRQDCPKVWEINGSIYIINVKSLREKHYGQFTKVKKFEMDEFSSHDIDTELDWLVAESILKKSH